RVNRIDPPSARNWLDAWWSQAAYLTWRQPLMVNSNWYILIHHDPLTQHLISQKPTLPSPSSAHGYTHIQILRAATMTMGLLHQAREIRRGAIAVEKTRTGPLCMDQYRRVFGVTRRPGLTGDTHVLASTEEEKANILVLLHNRFFRLSLPTGMSDHPSLEVKEEDQRTWLEVYENLLGIVHLVSRDPSRAAEPIASYTAAHRDTWARARENLLNMDEINAESLHEIEDTLMVIALDNQGLEDTSSSDQLGDDPAWIKRLMCGQRDRWYDSAMTLIVDQLGRAGINGEHSPCDALIPSLITFRGSQYSILKELSFVLNDALRHELHHTILPQVQAAANDSDLYVLSFTGYGYGWIKKIAKTSPDAYVQMVLQAAYYHLHNAFAPTYETASTRSYLLGRTECIRSLSTDSISFCRLLQAKYSGTPENREVGSKEVYDTLIKATMAHSTYTRMASQGQGCDRHLLGLSMCVRDGEDPSPLFSHPLVKEASNWKLSTSSLFPGAATRLRGAGFGAVTPDGYGINYLMDDHVIRMGIESKVSDPSTSSRDFAQSCIWAFGALREVCEEVSKSDVMPSRL
ncbi:acyltransferase ChoActase/COT/CPT, partial [Piptocephalis cylindrospora]